MLVIIKTVLVSGYYYSRKTQSHFQAVMCTFIRVGYKTRVNNWLLLGNCIQAWKGNDDIILQHK